MFRGIDADLLASFRCKIRCSARNALILAHAGVVVRIFHLRVGNIVDSLDAVGVVHCKLWVGGCLNQVVDDAIPNSECVHGQYRSIGRTVGNCSILIREVVKERRVRSDLA